MNILVAGIHGVGKSYLASQVAASLGLLHTSASKLIKDELGATTWTAGKVVADVAGNQIALARAVKKHNETGARLLIDGHFVLYGSETSLVEVPHESFRDLHLSGVILLDAPADVVQQRVLNRDGRLIAIPEIVRLADAERERARAVCTLLSLPLEILESPSDDELRAAINLF